MMSARWTVIALLASAALNLFLVAAGVTLFVLGAGKGFDRPPERANLRAAAMALAPAHRNELKSLLRAAGQNIQGANQQARALRIAAWGSLGSATFDPAVAKADLARARALSLASRGKIEDAVVDFAVGLPAAERAEFGEALRRAWERQSRAAPPARSAVAR